MTSADPSNTNYWQLLEEAFTALDGGDYPLAESLFLVATDMREKSPGRVFFTEKLGDGLRRLFQGGREDAAAQAGRWDRRAERFRIGFLAEGERVVREGVRLAELRPEDDAETNQPVLTAALFLVARSRLFPEEPASAVPLLKGLFRTARRTGLPFPVELVRHDLPLPEEDRLWLARRGGEILESFVDQGHLSPGSEESAAWAEVFLDLLHSRYFGLTGRLEEERCWLEAVMADRLLMRPEASVELYRAFLAVSPDPGPRPDEARVRLLELLANTDAIHFPTPRYRQALGAMQAAGLAPGSELAPRYEKALARIEHRRPEADGTRMDSLAWASVAFDPDGRLAAVFWWDAEPRDLAFWESGQDPDLFEEFLAACGDRLVAADPSVLPRTDDLAGRRPAPWCVGEFLTALFETRVGEEGLTKADLADLAQAETAPWRGSWDPELGHPLLRPRRGSGAGSLEPEGPGAAALQAGLAWLAVRSRVAAADPTLRAGLGELGRRGDPAARFLYDFLTLDKSSALALDASFEAWTLPLLWTRPDPFDIPAHGGRSRTLGEVDLPGLRPDLGRNDLAIVATGDPAGVLAAWGGGREKWRVVLDRLDRLEALSQVAGGSIGPVTLIPAEGSVHSLPEALALLDSLTTRRGEGQEGLLALFHWIRLVESHNGDLLDFLQIRPRVPGAVPLFDLYAEVVADLPRERPRLEGEDHLDSWGGQFSQRVRKAGLVAGTVAHLGADTTRLDSLWGVFEGSDASWVFLDSAAVHWSLLSQQGDGIRELHALLHSRGRRHLSLLTGAVVLREDLDDLLAGWLGVFGTPYHLSLTDCRTPPLKLADRGVQPESCLLASEAMAGQATWLDRRVSDGPRATILVPGGGRTGEFWSAVRSGEVPIAGTGWRFVGTGGGTLPGGDILAVPALASLENPVVPVAGRPARGDWTAADEERRTFVTARRRMMALEFASHLAGPWNEVAVLDTRWWRLLIPEGEGSRNWSGLMAVADFAGEGALTFDLPGNQGGDLPLDARMLDQAATWARRRTDGPPAWHGDAAPAGPRIPDPGRGAVILRAGSADPWPTLADRVAAAWDRGLVDRWIMLVADAVPRGASRLVAGGWSAGLSVWDPALAVRKPAPVMWVAPEDFSDPELRRYLDRHPPETVLAGDLEDWLPGPDRPSQETALALRGILDSGAASILLRAETLPDSWTRFLEAACEAGARGEGIVDGQEAAGPPPSPTGPGLDSGGPTDPANRAHRLKVLLSRLRGLLASARGEGLESDLEPAPPPVRQLLPLPWLGRLAGLSPDEVAEGVRLLRWTARLAGDSLSSAEGDPDRPNRAGQGHALLIPERFADLETVLTDLDQNLAVVLPLWLAHGRPGTLAWIDLELPPARIEPRQMTLLDEFLGEFGHGRDEGPGLVYVCPPGRLHSSRRLVGSRRDPAEVVRAVRKELGVFHSRLVEVMASALETAEGFLVETGLVDLRDEELRFLGLGSALGFWRWLGPASGGALHVVDLLTLAESPTAQEGRDAWRLWEEEMARLNPGWVSASPVVAEPVPAPGRRGLRSLLAVGAQRSDDLDPVVDRVAALAGGQDDGNLLVLKGVLGTGRHEALVRGLLQAHQDRPDPPRVTVHCPDQGVAAQVAREFLAQGLSSPLDMRVAAEGPVPGPGQPMRHPVVDHGGEVVVLCELQRFDAETRYRIAQSGRGRRLLMTADPAAVGEPWENLFLTTPRSDDVVELTVQRHQVRRLWNEVRQLLPLTFQGKPGTHRRDKGGLMSDYAANLDQGLARLVHEFEAGRLPDRLRVTAPMAADLQYLGSSLRERGWLAVQEETLDGMLLPGPREFLAAATDCLSRGGDLAAWFDPGAVWREGEQDDGGVPAEVPPPDLLTERLLGPEAEQDWIRWMESTEVTGRTTLLEFAEMIAGTGWANSFLAWPEARVRVVRLLETWGRESLADLLDQPQWEAWWYVMMEDLAAAGPVHRRPLAVLASAERLPGTRWPGTAYLCLGPESSTRHYETLARVTDHLLVLYQEHSPLPGDRPS